MAVDLKDIRQLNGTQHEAFEELCERLAGAGAPSVSPATMCSELQRLDLPRKKSRSTTPSATRRGSSG